MGVHGAKYDVVEDFAAGRGKTVKILTIVIWGLPILGLSIILRIQCAVAYGRITTSVTSISGSFTNVASIWFFFLFIFEVFLFIFLDLSYSYYHQSSSW